MVFPQKLFKIIRRAVTPPDPNHLRWKSSKNAEIAEVNVLGNYYEVFTLCIFADFQITGSIKTDTEDMFGVGEQIAKARYQSWR